MRAMLRVKLLILGTLFYEGSGQTCREAFQEMLEEGPLLEKAENYVNAVKDECSDSILEAMRLSALSGAPDGNITEKSAANTEYGETPEQFMCEFNYDEFDGVTTLAFDGSLSEKTPELRQSFKTACQAKSGRKFCSLSFSGGAIDGPELQIELVLDYENLATCIPEECDHEQNDVEALTQQFLGQNGFFGFETGIDITNIGRIPVVTCMDSDADAMLLEASAFKSSSSTSNGFSLLRGAQCFATATTAIMTISASLVLAFSLF